MSQLTLRDIASNEEIIVPPEGFVFGRAGGDADIQLDDNTISRRQARVSSRQGAWLLEVMVVPPGQRIPRPQPLQQGQTFFIGESEFEVVAVEGAEAAVLPKTVPSRKAVPPAAGPAKAAPRKDALSNKTVAAQPAQKWPTPVKQPASADEEESETRSEDSADADADEGDGEGGVAQDLKALFVGVPKGAAYYLVNVPKLLVNPLGTVRTAIDELPEEPLGPTGLIGYALPAMLATLLLGSIASGLAQLIRGQGFSLLAFFPIIPAVIAVVASVVSGFALHPVLGWILKILKGESDDRSRTNFFLQIETVLIIVAVPAALGTILGSLPIPFIGLLDPLFGALTSLVTLYVLYQWLINGFKVVDWFRYVLLVCGAAAVVFSAYGLVKGVITTLHGPGSDGSVATGPVSGDDEEAIKDAERLQNDAPSNTSSATMEATAKAEKAAPARAKTGAATAEDAAAAKDSAKSPPADEPSEPAPAKGPPAATRDDVVPTSAYGVFARRLEAVEKKLEADPTLLRNTELQRLYGDFLEVAYKLDRSYQKEVGRHPEREKLYRLQKNDQLFSDTSSTVDKLATKLGVH